MQMTKTELYEHALLQIAWLSEPNSDVADIAEEVLMKTGVLRTPNDDQLEMPVSVAQH